MAPFGTWNSGTPGSGGGGIVTGFGNPIALVGLTQVNGDVTTAMRSNAAPALSQAIVPLWTGKHTHSVAPQFDIPSAALGYVWTATDVDGNGVWAAGAAGGVTSVFGRTGDVVALTGDYSAFYSPLGHTHTGVYQPADTTLDALAGLNATAGLVEQTGADAFTKRAIGVANATDILTRADGDARYTSSTLDTDLAEIAALANTAGHMLYTNATDNWALLAGPSAANQVMRSSAANTFAWGALVAGDLPSHSHSATDITSGILVPARGGSGTGTVFTAGSVVFAGASGVYSQNNANLFWDNNGAGRLGILTATPFHALQVGGDIKVGASADSGVVNLGDISGAGFNVGIFRGLANTIGGGNYLNLGGFAGISLAVGAVALGSQTQVMALTPTGVGIFTAAPFHALQITGDVKIGSSATSGVLNLGDITGSGFNVGVFRGLANTIGGGSFLNLGGFSGISLAVGNVALGSQTQIMELLSTEVTFKKPIVFAGSTSGALTFLVPATVTSYALTWPAASADGYVRNVGGTLSFVAAPAPGAHEHDWTNIINEPVTLAGYGITGTLAEFNAALTGADFATGGGTATGTNTGDQTSIVGITGTIAQFNTACTDADFAIAARAITAGTGLTGGGDLTADRTLSLADVLTAGGPTGSTTVVPVITWDAKGRLTAVTTAAIAFPADAVTSVFTRTGAVVAATNDYTWAQINKSTSSLVDITTRLISDTTGTLAIARGGTGQITAALAFNALSPMTTAGDTIYGGASGVGTRLAAGTATQVLHGGTTPSWSAVSLTADVSGDLPFANLAQGSARSVLGVTGNATADFASIQGAANQALVVNAAGTALAFGTLLVAGGGTGATTFTAGRVLFGNDTSAILTNANLFWDNGASRLGIKAASPTETLAIGYGANTDMAIGSATNNKIYLGTFNDGASISINRNVSTGVFAQPTLYHVEIGLSSQFGYIAFRTPSTYGVEAMPRRLVGLQSYVPASTYTDLVMHTIANGTSVAASGEYCVEIRDGTNIQIEIGSFQYRFCKIGSTFNPSLPIVNEVFISGQQKLCTTGTITVSFILDGSGSSVYLYAYVVTTGLGTLSAGFPRITFELRNLTHQNVVPA